MMKKYTKLLIALLTLGCISALEATPIKVFGDAVNYVCHRQKKSSGWTNWHTIKTVGSSKDYSVFDFHPGNDHEYSIKVITGPGSGQHKYTNIHKGGAFIGKTTWDLSQPDDKEIY